MNETLLIALQLLLAHVLTDFVLQPEKAIKQKWKHKAKAPFLYFHAFLAGLLTYFFLQQWTSFLIPIIVMVTHFAIDLWKLNQKTDDLKTFLLDQFFHLLVLLFAWLYLTENFNSILPFFETLFSSKNTLILILGYLIVIFPFGFIIGKATQSWQEEIEKDDKINSLEKAGRYIGIFERILVLTFVLTQNIAAIGFFNEHSHILKAEYCF